MVKVSVIVPVYNVEPYIRRSLDSLVNQTLKDIEIILIDDCSTDGSLNIAREYASKDSRIQLIELNVNQGAAVARNKGLEIAKGEYLGFVDPDDAVDLNFYEELYKKAHSKNLDLVKCSRIKIGVNGNITNSELNKYVVESINNFRDEWQTAIYRASLVYDNNIFFPPEVRKAQDVVFLCKVVLKAKTYAVIDNVNYYYYSREDSLNAKKIPLDSIKSALIAIQYISDEYTNALIKGKLSEQEYIKLYFINMQIILMHTITQNDMREAKRLCIEKYIELYNKCKMKTELEQLFPLVYKNILDLVKKNDAETLTDIFIKCKNFKEVILYFLRQNIKKDISNAKSISNCTCI